MIFSIEQTMEFLDKLTLNSVTELMIQLLQIVVPIILTVFFNKKKYDINIFFRRSYKRHLKENYKLFKFYKSIKNKKMVVFTEQSIAEYHFYQNTDIKTNSTSIRKYLKFKEKLGENYMWKDVRIIKGYLVLQKDEIKIEVKQGTFIVASILYFFLVALMLITLFILVEHITTGVFNTIPIFLFFLFFIHLFMIKIVFPPIYANGIKKKLEKKEEIDNKSTSISKK